MKFLTTVSVPSPLREPVMQSRKPFLFKNLLSFADMHVCWKGIYPSDQSWSNDCISLWITLWKRNCKQVYEKRGLWDACETQNNCFTNCFLVVCVLFVIDSVQSRRREAQQQLFNSKKGREWRDRISCVSFMMSAGQEEDFLEASRLLSWGLSISLKALFWRRLRELEKRRNARLQVTDGEVMSVR